jgi:hypothetical protein
MNKFKLLKKGEMNSLDDLIPDDGVSNMHNAESGREAED